MGAAIVRRGRGANAGAGGGSDGGGGSWRRRRRRIGRRVLHAQAGPAPDNELRHRRCGQGGAKEAPERPGGPGRLLPATPRDAAPRPEPGARRA
eukprot:1573211-Alexandrium_andersonii.AAC.1